jgi:hypothetical protein
MPQTTDMANQQIQFEWTTSGLMEISLIQNAVNVYPEVSDFLAAQLIEQLVPSDITGVPTVQNPGSVNAGVIDVALARIGNRYLCISYGQMTDGNLPFFTQILVQDLHLKRWGKLVVNHVAVVHLPNSFSSVADLHNIGIIETDGSILCATEQVTNTVNGVLQNIVHSGVLIMGGINFVRNNTSVVSSIELNYGHVAASNDNAENITVGYSSSVDSMNLAPFTPLVAIPTGDGSAKYGLRKQAPFHFFRVSGFFHISELEVKLFKGGNR